MILNCYTCGKSVSNHINLCPYCKAEVISLDLTAPLASPITNREKRKGLAGAILSALLLRV